MDELTALIYNFNTDCHKQYTNVSNHLGNKLDDVLKKIERFYYSEFWEDRYIQRLKDLLIPFDHIQLAKILGTTSELRDDTKFKLFDSSKDEKGVSNNGTMIALNTNIRELNDSLIENIIMHEFGHRLYNQPDFELIIKINKFIIGKSDLYIKNDEYLSRKDFPYFTNHNELRLRIIPVIKEMWVNNWSAEEAYESSENLKIDDIKDIFTKEYIILLLKNIL